MKLNPPTPEEIEQMRVRSADRGRGPAGLCADALTDIPRLLMEVDRLNAKLDSIRSLVVSQAKDEMLWAVPAERLQTMAESYLQQELRRLHAAIESNASDMSTLGVCDCNLAKFGIEPHDPWCSSSQAEKEYDHEFVQSKPRSLPICQKCGRLPKVEAAANEQSEKISTITTERSEPCPNHKSVMLLPNEGCAICANST